MSLIVRSAPRTRRRDCRTGPLRAVLLASLWSCAVLMQMAGLLHAYAHPRPVHDHGAAQAPEAAGDERNPSNLRALFTGHAGDSGECELFDQLAHAVVLMPAPPLSLQLPAAHRHDTRHAAWHHARQSAGYLARGPPAA